MIEDVLIVKLDVIDTPGGNVMHAMKKTSVGYMDFGEAYFSQVDEGAIKAWKRHKNMILNLVVPTGKIKFVLFDDREVSNNQFQEVTISRENYCRLTIPPMVWVGFQGMTSGSMLLNIASIEHDPLEVDRLAIDKINYNWSVN
ncbi:MAG: WxcM-like domain-containing protein [Proteobacteria bacterium]|nr:WxcM-like domain-containing protein [Pseudomonadota bacterium]MCH9749774.1 WxcM-like domain-containing protein [Pseudomonadota bacterium]